MNLREITLDDVDWIHQAQNTDWWWALVNIVMNLFTFHKRWGIS
jgi:hypothetical protein